MKALKGRLYDSTLLPDIFKAKDLLVFPRRSRKRFVKRIWISFDEKTYDLMGQVQNIEVDFNSNGGIKKGTHITKCDPKVLRVVS